MCQERSGGCCKELGLKLQSINVPIYGVGQQLTRARNSTTVTIQSRITGFKRTLDCLVVEKITQDLPSIEVDRSRLRIPKNVPLADPQFDKPSRIDMLLGAETFFELMAVGTIRLARNQPIWQNTLLGWIVSGSCSGLGNSSKGSICNVTTTDSLNRALTKFWQIESCERKDTRTPEERACEDHFMKTHKRDQDGKFVVSLPFKEHIMRRLGTSREIAVQRFKNLERRFGRDPQLKMEYSKFIHEYSALGHMRELTDPVDNAWPHFYMPHHCVIKAASSTTRLRVVFDASCKSSTGISLNNTLMVGPVLQQELISILLRFRTNKYVLTSDIEKMYRQIKVEAEQTSLQRIIWRNDPSENMKTYELLTLTYGTAPASFIATKVIQRLADLEAHKFPKGAAAAYKDFYVDDFISGADTLTEAIEIRDQVSALLEAGGFKLRKWASNSARLLEGMQSMSSPNQLLELDKCGSAKTLGINWNPAKDMLQYRFQDEASLPKTHTKRTVLSQIAHIFDPIGLLGPVITRSKILMQDIWRNNLDWDDPLPPKINAEWTHFIQDLVKAKEIEIPRRVRSSFTEGDNHVEIHGFSDA
ncbi:uncharacterized protein, partial [Mycetomoellerius zeteki]|uniref:uncharacterized protein n=1 Tax=Mycetomoellerius zeteki TaxID=64791 RepID=UPI00084E7F07